ncbi:MAG: response regulator transcription factor [Anaerolineales bacterium]|nr:response regulator transcription factor [Anaerolineales bacterium]
MPETIRVLLVDDQKLIREGLQTLMELQPDIDVVGEAENGLEALAKYEELTPNVILMDIRMPEMDGVTATREIITRWPGALVIILTTFDDDQYVFEGLRAGAQGYMLKDVSGSEIAAAIRTVAAGGTLIEPSVARKVVAEFARLTPAVPPPDDELIDELSEREAEILGLMANGLTNKEIAQQLFLAEGTVKNYVSNVLRKLDARDRTQAILKAQELGIV